MFVEEDRTYHPYAACLMFKSSHNSNVVQANLDSVVAHGYQLATKTIAERITPLTEQRTDLINAIRTLQDIHCTTLFDKFLAEVEEEI